MTMKTHYSEADLLETYYLQPGESMPVMMHLAQCSECAARYERLEKKLRDAASCHVEGNVERPETFWTRQRHLIMRGISTRRDDRKRVIRTLRVAATAAFAFFLGGAVMYEGLKPVKLPAQQPIAGEGAGAPRVTAPASDDPWESDQLKNLHSVVQWESWIDNNGEDEL